MGAPDQQHRQSIRLQNYDYGQSGTYFVTACTRDRECLFGEIVGDEMRLNVRGKIVLDCWNALPAHFDNAEIDAFVVMPNHVHGIIVLVAKKQEGAACRAPTGPIKNMTSGSLAAVIVSFKSNATRIINRMEEAPSAIWQRNYYEHIVRSESELNIIRRYITENPMKWSIDRENPKLEKRDV